MAKPTLRYDKMVENALRSVVRDALAVTAKEGLPGAHHFYITFRTDYAGVEVPDFLHAQYPHEMTIVLEHQFWGLEVDDEKFAVTLSFHSQAQRLIIPLSAITAFADPSVKFGLEFRPDITEEQASSPKLLGDPVQPAKSQTAKPSPAKTLPAKTLPARAESAKADSVQPDKPSPEKAGPDKSGPDKSGEVVKLDTFRKK